LNKEESIERRRKALIEEVEERGFEAVVLLNEVVGQNPSNFVYMYPGGLGGEHKSLILDINGGSRLVTPHWGAGRIEEGGEFDEVIPVKQEKGHHIRGTLEALKGYDLEKVCFDLSTLSTDLAFQLGEGIGLTLSQDRNIADHVFELRTIKDEYEIDEMRRAIEITEIAFTRLIQDTRPGLNTWEMKKDLDADLINLGAYGFSFDSSIRFIKGNPLPGVLKHGDSLCLDVGVRVDSGYCSDMGRNWPVTLEKETKDYMERAAQAQEEGIKNIREGLTGNRVLELANEINADLGFQQAVRTGHQVGLDVHDYTMPHAPSFGPIETDDQPLKAGMTLTYEPTRIDLETGYKGHIEDIVLVTEEGPIVLNEMPYLWHR
jgi:Xaa-Pro aminopeptidase